MSERTEKTYSMGHDDTRRCLFPRIQPSAKDSAITGLELDILARGRHDRLTLCKVRAEFRCIKRDKNSFFKKNSCVKTSKLTLLIYSVNWDHILL